MSLFRIISQTIILGVILAMAEGGIAVQTWPEVWGQPEVILNLTGGSRTTAKIKLAGARNEHLFFTVLLEGGSASLRARVEGLPNGFAGQVFRVVSVPHPSAGKFPPDALIPLEEDIPGCAAAWRIIWISLKIDPACLPGLYSLNLVLTDKQASIRLPVEVKVYRFSLPEDLPITIFGGLWHQPGFWSRYARGFPGEEMRIIKSYCRSLREYKINALGGSYPLPLDRIHPGHSIEAFSSYHELLRYVLNDLKFKFFQIPKLNGWESISNPDSTFRRQARIFYPLYRAYLRRHGWENRSLNYLVDEPRPNQYEAVVQAFALSKSLAPGIRTLSAGWRPSPQFARVIDIWSHQAAHYREDERDKARRQGQEAWLYANRLHGIDHPLTHPRLIGWLLYGYQFSGYLLWGVNYWPQDPWTSPPGPQDFLRRGTFYYPHPQTGLPIPTTRLEALRRGLQDYQYFLLLDQACRRGLVPQEKQAEVLAKVHRLTGNLPGSSFPVSMVELDAVRLHIGTLLDGASAAINQVDSQTGITAGEGATP